MGPVIRSLTSVVGVAVACCAGCGDVVIFDSVSGDKPSAGVRHYRMGFSPFPPDQSTEAITWVNEFVGDHADVVAHYLEGVPWPEALAGEPYHSALEVDWLRERSADSPRTKSFVAMTPIDWGRTTLAAYRGETEGMALPPPFDVATFNDPRVISAYLNHCLRAIEYFEPDYLCIGIEVNELYHHSTSEWPAYVELHRTMYESLKRAYPDMPIFVSFSLQNMLNVTWEDRDEMLAAFKELMPYNDIIGVSFYPFATLLTEHVETALIWLRTEFDAFDKPYAICESGETAEPIVYEALGVTIPGSASGQESVLRSLLGFADTQNAEFVIWYIPRDYDALFVRVRGEVPDFFRVWQHCGLIDSAGNPRSAFVPWAERLQLPYTPRNGE